MYVSVSNYLSVAAMSGCFVGPVSLDLLMICVAHYTHGPDALPEQHSNTAAAAQLHSCVDWCYGIVPPILDKPAMYNAACSSLHYLTVQLLVLFILHQTECGQNQPREPETGFKLNRCSQQARMCLRPMRHNYCCDVFALENALFVMQFGVQPSGGANQVHDRH